jgi:hypothetical protein
MGGSGQGPMTGSSGMMGNSGSGGMMNGPGSGGMMGGYGSGSMMGAYVGTPQGRTTTLANAQQDVQQYLKNYGRPNLAIGEIMDFQKNFYAIVKDTTTNLGAFEVLVNKANGVVFPEYGPAMMWNTQYSPMTGMMGYQQPSGPMTVTAAQAQTLAQTWLDKNQPGSTTETPDQFPGYYTLHILKDGNVTGMLSVNGYSGQIWYHTWHGSFVQMTADQS